jgi:hypothetical protein
MLMLEKLRKRKLILKVCIVTFLISTATTFAAQTYTATGQNLLQTAVESLRRKVILGGPDFELAEQRGRYREERRDNLRNIAMSNPAKPVRALVVLNDLYLLDDVAKTFTNHQYNIFYLETVAKVPGVETIQVVGSPQKGYRYQMKPTEFSFTIGGYDTGDEYFTQPLQSINWHAIGADIERSVKIQTEMFTYHLSDLQKRVSEISEEELRRLRDEKGIDYQFTIKDAKTRLEQMETIFPVGNPTANLRVYAIGLEGKAADIYDLWQNPQVDLVDVVPNLRAWHDLDLAPPRPGRSPF